MLRINYLISVPIRLAIMALLNAHCAISHKRKKYFRFLQAMSIIYVRLAYVATAYISGLCLTRATKYQSTHYLA